MLIVGWNLGRDDAYNQILEQIRGLLVENLKDRKILIRWRLISYLKKINDVTKKYEEIQIAFIQNHRWYSSWVHPGYDEFEWYMSVWGGSKLIIIKISDTRVVRLKCFEATLEKFPILKFCDHDIILVLVLLDCLVGPGNVRTKSIFAGWLLLNMNEVYLYYWTFTKCPNASDWNR